MRIRVTDGQVSELRSCAEKIKTALAALSKAEQDYGATAARAGEMEQRFNAGVGTLDPADNTALDDLVALQGAECLLELVHVELQLTRVLQQVLPLDFRLIFEQLVVILPEFPLLVRCQCSDSGERRVLVKVERKIFPDNADVVPVGLADLLEGRTDPPAEWSLKVGEFGDRYRSG